MLRQKGYSKVEEHALRILSDIVLDMLRKLMDHTKSISNLQSRSESTIEDLLCTFKKFGVNSQKLVEFIIQKNGAKDKKPPIAMEIMNHLTKRDPQVCRSGNGDLSRRAVHGNFKRMKMRSKYPVKLTSDDREKPMSIKLQRPPEFTYSETFKGPQQVHNRADIKNMKAQEKRIYEIENCKISAIADENANGEGMQIEDQRVEEKEKSYTNKNIFDQGSGALNDIGIFEISNNQMF